MNIIKTIGIVAITIMIGVFVFTYIGEIKEEDKKEEMDKLKQRSDDIQTEIDLIETFILD